MLLLLSFDTTPKQINSDTHINNLCTARSFCVGIGRSPFRCPYNFLYKKQKCIEKPIVPNTEPITITSEILIKKLWYE